MNWYKIANNESVKQKIKSILKSHLFIIELMKYYKVPIEDIDNNLEIEIVKLDGEFASGNGRKIFLDTKLFENNFFENNLHFVIHEFFHWLKRRNEDKFYFNDKEEVQSFVLAIAWELMNGKNKDQIIKSIYPIIENHFQDKNKSKQIFLQMFENASRLTEIYNRECLKI